MIRRGIRFSLHPVFCLVFLAVHQVAVSLLFGVLQLWSRVSYLVFHLLSLIFYLISPRLVLSPSPRTMLRVSCLALLPLAPFFLYLVPCLVSLNFILQFAPLASVCQVPCFLFSVLCLLASVSSFALRPFPLVPCLVFPAGLTPRPWVPASARGSTSPAPPSVTPETTAAPPGTP